MQKQLFFSVIFYFLCTSLFSQAQFLTYYQSINAAESNIIKQQHRQADSCFATAFNLDSVKGFNQDYLTASINAYLLKDTALLTKYLLAFAARGGNYTMLKNSIPANALLELYAKPILGFINLPQNKLLKQQMQAALKAYKKTLNKKISHKINYIYYSDQFVARTFSLLLRPKRGADLMEKTDRKNAHRLLVICQTYGWPGFNEVGEFKPYGKYGLSKFNILIRHFTQDELDKIEPYVIAAIKKVNACPDDWAAAIDYCAIKQPTYNDSLKAYEMQQIYGTQGNGMDKSGELIPFGNIDDVNRARQSLFLINIQDYCELRNKKLPEKEFLLIPKTQ